MSDGTLMGNVSEELLWDPKVDSDAIAIGANGGVITLRGTVGSFREKQEARKAAQRVFGVTAVNNELQVRLLDSREDADLRADALRVLMLDSLVPVTVDAEVNDGSVEGAVGSWAEHDEALLAAWAAPGVTHVDDRVRVEY
ncbi:MAG TPA: BON domain-containing protein [Solirubrobacteraceae bacterium]|nr:BON domain-containing protein [Solirubrobacteraceae bacterium]